MTDTPAVSSHQRVLPDEYVPPRFPVDDPPTYRQRCACGWTGPELYAGVDVDYHAQHAATVPAMTDIEGLTTELAQAIYEAGEVSGIPWDRASVWKRGKAERQARAVLDVLDRRAVR